MTPAASSAINAAGGRSRSAGSQMARTTANGTPQRLAASATLPLSRSIAPRARGGEQGALARSRCRDRRSGQQHVIRQAAKRGRQRRVRDKPLAVAENGVGHDDGARPQRRVQPARQPETDQAGRASGNQVQGRRRSALGRPAAGSDRPAPMGGDARFCRQSDHEAGRCGQKPTSTRLVLPRRRLR